MKRLLLVFLATALLVAVAGCAGLLHRSAPPPLILISLDGFRWDYCALHPAETPNLRRLASEGVSARGLIPAFPSNTFPNHYSIVTGLYPSHHGIINNECYDPGLGALFNYKNPAAVHDSRWWGGEPIWVTAEKQGRKSASSYWVGSEAEIKGVRPTFWRPYDYDKYPFDRRLDELSHWLHLPPAQRPAVIAFYLEETNSAGHKYGPDSPELAAAVKLLDAHVGAIAARLAAEGIAANLVVVSDHGMTACSPDRVVVIDDYLDLANVQVDFQDSCAGLRPLDGTDVPALMRALEKIPTGAQAYRATELPARFHVDAANPRVPPVWIVPAEGWLVMRRSLFNATKATFLKGQHGYDPAFTSMHGLFIANGPSFKSGVVIDEFENIHIYNLLCAALQLQPAPNDGDDRLVKSVLR